MTVMNNIMTVNIYSHQDYPDREVILATDHVEEIQAIFLLDRETQTVTRREWVSLDLPENVLINIMWEILSNISIERSTGHG